MVVVAVQVVELIVVLQRLVLFLFSALQFRSAKIVMLAENRDCVYERERERMPKLKGKAATVTRLEQRERERGW